MSSEMVNLSVNFESETELEDHSNSAEDPSNSVSIEGRDGWLFSRDAVLRLCDVDLDLDYSSSLSAWRDELADRQKQLTARGTRYLHIVAPDKSTLLGENLTDVLPATLNHSRVSPLRRFSSLFRAELPSLIDPTAYMQRQKEQHPLYWKSDTRWTPWAAYMTYQLLCTRLNVEVNKSLLGYPFNEGIRLMNLDADELPECAEMIRSYRFSMRSKRRYANELAELRANTFAIDDRKLADSSFAEGAYTVFENRHYDAPHRCLLIFGNENSMDVRSLLTGLLAETFSEVHFVWGDGIDYDIVENVHPDVVITQSNELQLLDSPATEFNVSLFAETSLQNLREWIEEMSADSAASGVTNGADSKLAIGSSLTRRCKVLLPEERYALDLPNMVQATPKIADADVLMCSNEVVLHNVSSAEVYFTGPAWWVHDDEGNEVLRHQIPESQTRPIWRRRGKTLHGTSLLFGTSAGAHCYYHWMMEILPKLGLLEREGIDLASIDHILVREITGEWQLESLARCGISPSQVVETVKQPKWRCDRLIHIDLNCGINLKMHRFIPLWMKHLYPSGQSTKTAIKLYITRPSGVRRGIANEDEFLPLLEERGFTIMAMEGLTVAEQAELLSRAEVLISAHGGALTNMVFCRPGIDVVEIFSRHVFPYYYGLAANCGHRYHAILQDPEDYPRLVSSKIAQSYADSQHLTASQSFKVSVDALKRTLERLDP